MTGPNLRASLALTAIVALAANAEATTLRCKGKLVQVDKNKIVIDQAARTITMPMMKSGSPPLLAARCMMVARFVEPVEP